MNILVGNNDSGKSTVIEAVILAATGRLNGKPLHQELSPYLINLDATKDYIHRLNTAQSGEQTPEPPPLVIEIYLQSCPDAELFRGNNNLLSEDACGLRIQAELASDFVEEYRRFVSKPDEVRLAPTEYYRVDWLGFSGHAVTARSVPLAASIVDPTTIRLQSGVDFHLQEIVRTHLDPSDRVELSRQYRSLRETFSEKESIEAINSRLRESDDSLTERSLSLGIDISRRYTWENNIAAHLDGLPFHLIGRGDQTCVKTLLAIGRRAEDTHVILIEEPENHLSFSSLRRLIRRIEERCLGKQVIVATHSNFVLNRLGLENLVLLGDSGNTTRLTDLPRDTAEYFKKLSGFDTLRLVLSKGVILVEGPSDDLIVQRAYRDAKKKLPIDDGIDVIAVGLAHKRFLELSVRLRRRTWIVADNDGKAQEQKNERFSDYLSHDFITLRVGPPEKGHTLEPQIVSANDLNTLNLALGQQYKTKDKAQEAMLNNKTTAALAIFNSSTPLVMPDYIKSVCRE